MRTPAKIRRALAHVGQMTRRSGAIQRTWPETYAFWFLATLKEANRIPFRFQWHGMGFQARAADALGITEVLLDEEYSFVKPVLAQARRPTVLDAGANIGLFSLYVFAVCPDAVIHAYEPGPATAALLTRNAARNPARRWTVYAQAIWDARVGVPFQVRTASTASRIATLEDAAGRGTAVPAIPLSEALARLGAGPVTLVKLDIEGAEQRALEEAEADLERVQHLIVEIHPDRADEASIRQLLARHFPTVRDIPGRQSRKPLLLASR